MAADANRLAAALAYEEERRRKLAQATGQLTDRQRMELALADEQKQRQMAGETAPTLEGEVQRLTGLQPNIERSNILPFYSQETGLVAPQFVYDAAKAVVAPGYTARGGRVDPAEAMNVAANVMGGSIGGEELAQFLGEVKSICDEVSPEKIDLLYWDTNVAGHETYQGAELCNLVESTQAKGGGGTDPDCVPAYMKKEDLKPECVIMLTDGYLNSDKAKWSSVTMPTMWCIKGNSRFNSDTVVGKIVHVE